MDLAPHAEIYGSEDRESVPQDPASLIYDTCNYLYAFELPGVHVAGRRCSYRGTLVAAQRFRRNLLGLLASMRKGSVHEPYADATNPRKHFLNVNLT